MAYAVSRPLSCDLILSGYLNYQVFGRVPQNSADHNTSNRQEFASNTKEAARNVFKNIANRSSLVASQKWGQFKSSPN